MTKLAVIGASWYSGERHLLLSFKGDTLLCYYNRLKVYVD